MTPIIVAKRWWTPPWGKSQGVTLYPFVFLRLPWLEHDLRHELIHCLQVQRQGWLGFYARYLWSLVRVGYRRVPAEAEAYANEWDPAFLPPGLERLVQEHLG